VSATEVPQELLRLTELELRAWVVAEGHRLGAALEPIARVVPAVWVLDGLGAIPFEDARAAYEGLARSPLPHVAHDALARLLEMPWSGRPAWCVRALREGSRDAQLIVLEAARHFGDDEVDHLASLLDDPSAEVRLAAVEALGAVGGTAQQRACAVLQRHLPLERSARVRWHVLETPGVVPRVEDDASGALPEGPSAALGALAEATVTALSKPVAPWFAERPTLRWEDGSEAPSAVGEYLLFCQRSCTGSELDPRAVQAAALLERRSLARWAVALLDAWIARKADVKHHGVLALAVALGGDAVVATVQRQVALWHRAGRRALASLACQLLAFLGSDRALRALDEIAGEHGYDTLGALATAALEAEASARGFSRDDLSDALVPRWRMSPEGKTWLDYGRRRFRVMLEASGDGALEVSLTEARWRVLAAPPKPARGDDPLRAEEAIALWRELCQELPRVVAHEGRRFERAMCVGRVWTAPRWTAHVLGHPVLRALAERLLWKVLLPGRRRPVFARTVHGVLLTERGTPFHLRDDARLSIAHPLDLGEDEQRQWRALFAAAGVPPAPFPQLARATFTHDAPAATAWLPIEGCALKVPSDRSRARPPVWSRTGWEPAALEAGQCRRFRRRYGSTEAVLEVDGFALWADHARETVVRALRFRDAAAGEEAPWLPLGAVPPVALSEAARAAVHMLHGGDDAEQAAEDFERSVARRPHRRRRE